MDITTQDRIDLMIKVVEYNNRTLKDSHESTCSVARLHILTLIFMSTENLREYEMTVATLTGDARY